jgi:hypothetical protein
VRKGGKGGELESIDRNDRRRNVVTIGSGTLQLVVDSSISSNSAILVRYAIVWHTRLYYNQDT